MASFYLLRWRCTTVEIDKRDKYTILNDNVADYGYLNIAVALVKADPNFKDNAIVPKDDYNYFTKHLVDPIFMNSFNVFYTGGISQEYDIPKFTNIIQQFIPGSKVVTTALPAYSSEKAYAVKLLDETSGNYCLISALNLSTFTRFYSNNSLVHETYSQKFIRPDFINSEWPNFYSGQCILATQFDSDGNASRFASRPLIGLRLNPKNSSTNYALYTDSSVVGMNDLDFANWLKPMKKYEPTPDITDPYDRGGKTDGAGGGGTFGGGNTIFGGASDSIDIPALPTASASAAGFITLFNPTLAQLNNLASYMWSDLFSLETFKKIFADPMDCILGLSIVPVKPASAGTSTVKIGNVSTDVSMNKTSSQYVAVDCGTIDVKEYWGAYLDYAPYTQCEIYLPYVGTKQISVDDVMNKAVHVVYHVDILSGACNAYVKCGDSVLYTFVGQCSSSIPISGNDWTNVLNGAISVAGKIGLAMATGGATALMSGLGAASSIISSSKPTVERSGAMSSTGGLLGIQKPYLILTRPKQALPENQNKYTGYPSFITMALSDCTGYTEVDSVHLENMSCTDEEAQEIESLLKSGVIF